MHRQMPETSAEQDAHQAEAELPLLVHEVQSWRVCELKFVVENIVTSVRSSLKSSH